MGGMNARPPHLFVDISSHGFGHLAQVAPVLNELARLRPDMRITVRSALHEARLRARIHGAFEHLVGRSDFGFVMHDSLTIDRAASGQAYRAQHANWAQRVADEAALLARLRADMVLSDVAYLPLAGAARAAIPSLSMSSLNWADLFAHYFSGEDWAPPLHEEMLAAYRSAECFLRLTPAMPMSELANTRAIAPVAAVGIRRGAELREKLACPPDEKLVLIAFGGVAQRLPVEAWPRSVGVRWLVPANWQAARADFSALEAVDLSFTDLLASVDAVITKPGYGTFCEAACNGTPVLYQRRQDGWPEQDCLIDWLQANARCAEVSERALAAGKLRATLGALWRLPPPVAPEPAGAGQAAALIAGRLSDCC